MASLSCSSGFIIKICSSISALFAIFLFVLYDNSKQFISIISLNIKDKNKIKIRQIITTIEVPLKSTYRKSLCPSSLYRTKLFKKKVEEYNIYNLKK